MNIDPNGVNPFNSIDKSELVGLNREQLKAKVKAGIEKNDGSSIFWQQIDKLGVDNMFLMLDNNSNGVIDDGFEISMLSNQDGNQNSISIFDVVPFAKTLQNFVNMLPQLNTNYSKFSPSDIFKGSGANTPFSFKTRDDKINELEKTFLPEIEAKISEIKEKSDKEIKELEKALQKMISEDKSVSKELKDAFKTNSENIDKKNTEISKKETAIKSKDSEIFKLQGEISMLEAENAAIPENAQNDELNKKNQARKAELAPKIAELKSKKAELEQEKKSLETEKQKLESEKQKLEAEKSKLEAEISKNESSKLKEQIKQTKAQIEEIKTRAQAETEAQTKTLEEKRNELLGLKKESGTRKGQGSSFNIDDLDGVALNLSNAQKVSLAQFKDKYEANKQKYDAVSAKTGVPPELIAAIHYRESGGDFSTYLHNGEKLGKPTTKVPAGKLFYDWESAAIDALSEKNPQGLNSFSDCLAFAERYNGLGYRKKGVNSPYVFAGTNKQQAGMYVADHVFNPDAIDKRLGIAAIMHGLSIV